MGQPVKDLPVGHGSSQRHGRARAEYAAERWLREAMILPIWEGTPHRQMLDGLEVMERKRAHQMLFEHLAPHADPSELQHISSRIEEHLPLPAEEKEAGIENVFRDLAAFTARTLGRKYVAGPGC